MKKTDTPLSVNEENSTHASVVESMVLDFFCRIIESKSELDQRFHEEVSIHKGELRFTLKGLFQVMWPEGRTGSGGQPMSYENFRTAVYAGNINQQLRLRGFQVVLAQRSSGKVDTNRYRLAQLAD